jgi:hypothetical protein
LWTLRGIIQFADNRIGGDSLKRLERCSKLMASPEFPRHVAAVRQGSR